VKTPLGATHTFRRGDDAERPTFSVVIPTFNRAHLLPRAIESVIRQTWNDWELIIADDGSSDGTRELVRRYETRDRRIRFCQQANQGGGAARNLGADAANGRYIVFLDSDDEVANSWLASFSVLLDSKDTAIACCGITMLNQAGGIRQIRLPESRGLFLSGTFALRREVFDEAGGYDTSLRANQQSELRFRLSTICETNAWNIACFAEPLVTAHQHPGPNVRGDTRAVYESAVIVLDKHGARLRKNPRSFASWATSAGGYAAKLGMYREARTLFVRALSACPLDWKNYARVVISFIPLARSWLWAERDSA